MDVSSRSGKLDSKLFVKALRIMKKSASKSHVSTNLKLTLRMATEEEEKG